MFVNRIIRNNVHLKKPSIHDVRENRIIVDPPLPLSYPWPDHAGINVIFKNPHSIIVIYSEVPFFVMPIFCTSMDISFEFWYRF